MEWRLIYSPSLSGAWNMAIDEAMLLAHLAGLTPPTLRLYRWQPPAVSLGLLQPFEAVNETACRQLGFDIVRRPSGGSAVLHQHEITYAVVVDGRLCPQGSSVLSTYRWLSEGLKLGLKHLGIEVSFFPSPHPTSLAIANRFKNHFEGRAFVRPKIRSCMSSAFQMSAKMAVNSFCFARLTNADLSVNGRKLIGSAQARKRNFLLQHGSIPLRLDMDAVVRVFGSTERENFTWVEEVLGRKIEFGDFAEALVRGFSEALDITFTVNDLTPTEYQLASLLFRYKYSTVTWTKERRVYPKLTQEVSALLLNHATDSSA